MTICQMNFLRNTDIDVFTITDHDNDEKYVAISVIKK